MSELSDKIAEMADIKFDYSHVGLREEGNVISDRWNVAISYKGKSYTTEYFTGIGNRGLKPRVIVKPGNIYYFDGENKTLTKALECGWLKLGKPDLTDVIYCLLSDSSSAEETFEDWCSNFGHDTDSRKALDTYLACQKTRSKIISMFGIELFEELSQLEH